MKIGILGSGAYGISLAYLSYKNNNDVIVWSHREEERDILNKKRKSSGALRAPLCFGTGNKTSRAFALVRWRNGKIQYNRHL